MANSTWQLDDYNALQASQPGESTHIGQIINELLKSSMDSSRYFMALAGSILISLAFINIAQSKLQDRWQWGIVISRFAMGLALVFLLLLNLGHQFAWEATKLEAGVFRWVKSFWPLPTVAIAYTVEFFTEVVRIICLR
ncbi:unnamed protein product [Rhizoctonia solani]|uniref:Uncharacterized protein n=1 Tax=Rhizoctonia solani TaxID=456999 RepID=A0A8H3DPB1_9AGAM|nr:unnamed protein product [Rhizoctonia solani]